MAGWRGWLTHGGRLGPALTASELAGLEEPTGRLPDDFRRFLTEVAGPGAGPGYGLLPPRRVGDVVPLAQAGCNAVWVLDLGSHDVWVDSTPVDGRRHRVAGSFTGWYLDWLDNGLCGRGAWTHWNPELCATTGAVRQLAADASGTLTELTVVGWNDYLPPPAGQPVLDPCQGCAETLAQYGIPEHVVKPGALSTGG